MENLFNYIKKFNIKQCSVSVDLKQFRDRFKKKI